MGKKPRPFQQLSPHNHTDYESIYISQILLYKYLMDILTLLHTRNRLIAKHASSYRPKQTKQSIVYNQALCFSCICSSPSDFHLRNYNTHLM